MSTTTKYLRTGLLTRLGEAAGLANAAVSRLENAEPLTPPGSRWPVRNDLAAPSPDRVHC
jgi:hypothetical protein